LVYNGTDAGGWSHYEIHAKNATGYQPDRVPAVLLKSLPFKGAGNVIDSANHWKSVADLFYLSVSATIGAESLSGFSVADQMTSLAAPASVNGNLRFVDIDSNGLVDAGDRIDIHPPGMVTSNGWASYMIRIGNWSAGRKSPASPYGTPRCLRPDSSTKRAVRWAACIRRAQAPSSRRASARSPAKGIRTRRLSSSMAAC